jgi:protein-S-isoprenylcysteine O-methyltransferase Ste14
LGVGGAISQALMFAVVLFGIAGTADWPRGWVFVAVWSINIFIVCVVSTTEVMVERLWPLRDIRTMEPRDLALVLVLGPVGLGWFVLMPLDVFHVHLLGAPPTAVVTAGLALIIMGWVLITLATRQNPFASPVVKLQETRHQRVIDHGVYGIVRHPMYAGATLFVIGTPLWLGSYAATILSAALITGLCIRIGIEERLLRGGLDGYDAYTRRVRYRLVPFVW